MPECLVRIPPSQQYKPHNDPTIDEITMFDVYKTVTCAQLSPGTARVNDLTIWAAASNAARCKIRGSPDWFLVKCE
jgi:hypothetical protein